MIRCLGTGLVVPLIGSFPLLFVGAPSGAQIPTKDEARKLLGSGGGTILVYEIDRKEGAAHRDLTEQEQRRLANALQQRLEHEIFRDDIAVRPAGKDRIEVILPGKGKRPEAKGLTPEEVQRIKRLVSQASTLEFRILANGVDDKAAIEDARNLINTNNPEVQAKPKENQEKGLPPPAPHVRGLEGDLQRYKISLPRNEWSIVTYSWVELGPHERRGLGLDNESRDDPKRNAAWREAANGRGKATTLADPEQAGRKLFQGALFSSRECKDRSLPEKERTQKQVDYFVLARGPEIDVATGKETPRIDGRYLVRVMAPDVQVKGQRAVVIQLNKTGGALLKELTRKNLPSGQGGAARKRHLAIILDGLVIQSPTINSEIGENGQIAGKYTKQEVDRLANILRAGVGVGERVRPHPVAEIVIEPANEK
jgi:preprotein translocase subunit SecD